MPSNTTTSSNSLGLTCDEIAGSLADYADGVDTAPAEVRAHVEACLRCQAEMVQYRRLLKGLHNLRTEVLEPAPGHVTSVLAHIEAAAERGAIRSMLTGRRGAYVGGIALATAAAGAAGAVVLAGRARRRAFNVA
ncbi:MAG: hypothetical protein QOG90_208 [Actinomycetota bacterium]|jgi:hypothetical protein